MSVVVMKFGGSSLKDFSSREKVYQKIQSFLEKTDCVVMVVSALGRFPYPYATDSLLNFTDYNTPEEEKDLLLSVGETISSIVVAKELRTLGYHVKALNIFETGIITDDCYGAANVSFVNSSELEKAIKKYQIVIVPGFQGYCMNHHITTLGRGGSDLTAIWMSVALGLKETYIYTDVNGVYDKDPKKHNDAVLYDYISYKDMLDLCNKGSKVMYQRSVELAQEKGITIIVRNTYGDNEGTKITDFLC